MEMFSARQTFKARDEFVPLAIRAVKAHFGRKGFTFRMRTDSFSVTSLEMQGGNLFEQALGLKKGMVVTFTRTDDGTVVDVRDTVLRDQVAGPAALMCLAPQLRIPVLITGAFGMGMQSCIPGEVLKVISREYRRHTTQRSRFCPYCGTSMPEGESRCLSCGRTTSQQ